MILPFPAAKQTDSRLTDWQLRGALQSTGYNASFVPGLATINDSSGESVAFFFGDFAKINALRFLNSIQGEAIHG